MPRKPTKPAAKKLYHVPYLLPEHCTEEYMKANGVPWYGANSVCYAWEELCFGEDSGLSDERIRAGFTERNETPEENATAFNRLTKSLGARPTGKPYPLPRKATR